MINQQLFEQTNQITDTEQLGRYCELLHFILFCDSDSSVSFERKHLLLNKTVKNILHNILHNSRTHTIKSLLNLLFLLYNITEF